MFSEQFENYIYLNLELKEDRDLFNESLTIKELFQAILVVKNIRLKEGQTLLFIDEIQNSSTAVKMLRYFYEDMKELYVIAAGSLLETMLDKHDIGFPVGRVEFLYMYPISFEEFLEAMNEKPLLEIYRTVPVKKFAHSKLLKLFHLYSMIGGLPEIVQQYINDQDVTSLKTYYESLLTSYLDDSAKYARNSTMRQVLKAQIKNRQQIASPKYKLNFFQKPKVFTTFSDSEI